MRYVFGSGRRRDAQTLVFFLLAWGTIMLLCGLAIDSGLLYLAKARMGRAVDGAALAAVGNFNRNSDPVINRDDVALIMRNFAAANFSDLASISTTGGPSGGTASTYTLPNGQSATQYTYNFNDGTQDPNGQYRRFVQVILNTGSGGNITSATCNARCPVQTYFIGYATYAIGGRKNVKIGGYSGPSSLVDLKVSSEAVASRNPRLIMVVLDRSASMLQPGGGAYGLPQSVVQFLDFFDTSSDYIGIVSFGANARLEMPLTTNFIDAATNVLFDAYAIATNGSETNGVPGPDPEEFTTNDDYDSGYATTGVRRMKFGGQTAADEGIRLAMEQLMANSGFNDPDVVKYMVIFTDGKWNQMRALVAAPGYTNVVTGPPASNSTNKWVTNTAAWSTTLTSDTNLVPVPTMSPMPYVTNAISQGSDVADFSLLAPNHLNDQWQSIDSSGYEPLNNPTTTATEGAPMLFTTNTWVGVNGTKNYYARNIDVWLQPGAVDYVYHSGSVSATYVSNYNVPDQHVNVMLGTGDSNVLVVPGYVVDGLLYDGLDMAYPDNPTIGLSGYPRYRSYNYQEPFMWPDDTNSLTTSSAIFSFAYAGSPTSSSLMRQLMFRNYPNLLTGFYVNRADDPLSTQTEPLDDTTPATRRPLNGLGPYYPGAAFYWPFDMVGVDYDPTYMLTNAVVDPDVTSPYQGYSRHGNYSINMLSPAAAPEWCGEWFYESTSGGGTNVTSGTGNTSVSSLMATKAQWEAGAPQWLINDFDASGAMTNEAAHNTNLAVSVWRPYSFNGVGSPIPLSSVSPSDSANYTGGYVTDGAGNYYRNTMAYSGRPTHYFDFSLAKWMPIRDNHDKNIQFLPLCNWKAEEYAWHARAQGVTIYTVGYGQLVYPAQQVLLAQIANATNTTAGNPQVFDGSAVTSYTPGPGTAIPYNPSQPIGQQFYATNVTDISNDFYQVGQAINSALTQ